MDESYGDIIYDISMYGTGSTKLYAPNYQWVDDPKIKGGPFCLDPGMCGQPIPAGGLFTHPYDCQSIIYIYIHTYRER